MPDGAPTILERTSILPDVRNGRLTIGGLRISVETILGFLAAGDSCELVLEQYPLLEREDIQACLRFATHLMARRYAMHQVA
jgi:uncharacterized protein (DUF433 family)